MLTKIARDVMMHFPERCSYYTQYYRVVSFLFYNLLIGMWMYASTRPFIHIEAVNLNRFTSHMFV